MIQTNTRFLLLALVVSASIASSKSQASSFNGDPYFEISSIDTVEVTPKTKVKSAVFPVDGLVVAASPEPTPSPAPTPDPTPEPSPTLSPTPEPTPVVVDPLPPIQVDLPSGSIGGIDIGTIVTVGSTIWKIIEANQPVVTSSYQPASLLPTGVKSWDELETWSEPQVRLFRTTYRNAFNMKVIEFTYRVIYTINGSYDGKGKFLSRVEIEPANLNVAWGYKMSVVAEVVNPTNAGTRTAPLAAMELRVNWTVNTVFKYTQSSTRFYVRGDGLFKDVTNGNIQ